MLSLGGGAAVSVVAVLSDLVDVPVADAIRAEASPGPPLAPEPLRGFVADLPTAR